MSRNIESSCGPVDVGPSERHQGSSRASFRGILSMNGLAPSSQSIFGLHFPIFSPHPRDESPDHQESRAQAHRSILRVFQGSQFINRPTAAILYRCLPPGRRLLYTSASTVTAITPTHSADSHFDHLTLHLCKIAVLVTCNMRERGGRRGAAGPAAGAGARSFMHACTARRKRQPMHMAQDGSRIMHLASPRLAVMGLSCAWLWWCRRRFSPDLIRQGRRLLSPEHRSRERRHKVDDSSLSPPNVSFLFECSRTRSTTARQV